MGDFEKVVGVCMFRDEADVIAHTLTHMAEEALDGFVIADNLSKDGSGELAQQTLRDLGVPFYFVRDDELGYYQSTKMSALASVAARMLGATWIVPFDADELWYSTNSHLANDLRAVKGDIVRAALYNHYCTSIDPPGDNPFETMQWRMRNPGEMPKVAFRWGPGAQIHQGNHGVTLSKRAQHCGEQLLIRHFSYRSAEQMVRKSRNGAEAYAATDLPEHEGAHWRSYGKIIEMHGDEAMANVFREHFWYASPTDSGLILDPAPFRRWSRS